MPTAPRPNYASLPYIVWTGPAGPTVFRPFSRFGAPVKGKVNGIVARIGGGTVLLRGEGVNETHLQTMGREESLWNLMITAGAFHGDD
jgi:hypothetical protein